MKWIRYCKSYLRCKFKDESEQDARFFFLLDDARLEIQGTPLSLSLSSLTWSLLSLLLPFFMIAASTWTTRCRCYWIPRYRIVSGDLYKASPALPKLKKKTQWQSSSSRNCVCRPMNSNRSHSAQGTGRGHQTDLGHELKLSKGRERERKRKRERKGDHEITTLVLSGRHRLTAFG